MIVMKWSKRKPSKGDDPEYLKWIRTLPCLACIAKVTPLDVVDAPLESMFAWGQLPNQCGPTEVAHVGPRSIGRRCPDRETIPLGRGHHNRVGSGGWPDSHHNLGTKFWETHHIDRDLVIAELQRIYEAKKG